MLMAVRKAEDVEPVRQFRIVPVEESGDLAMPRDGTVLAEEVRPELTMSAKAHGALHVSFQRDVNSRIADPAVECLGNREPHHDLRAAGEQDRPLGVDAQPAEQDRHHAHVPVPGGIGPVDGDQQLQPLTFPVVVFCREEKVGRLARSVEEDEPAVLAAVGQKGPHHGRSGARPSPPATSTTSRPRACLERPATAVGAAQPDHRARPPACHHVG